MSSASEKAWYTQTLHMGFWFVQTGIKSVVITDVPGMDEHITVPNAKEIENYRSGSKERDVGLTVVQ